MAKLKDLINVDINRDVIKIQGVEIPIVFTMVSFEYISEACGTSYIEYEKRLNKMLESNGMSIGFEESRLMKILIYGMVRAGGTETTPDELFNAITIDELPDIFAKALEVFSKQQFQAKDMERLKTEKKQLGQSPLKINLKV